MKHIIALAVLIGSLLTPVAAHAQTACTFTLGFKQLHDAIPDIVGGCLNDAAYTTLSDGHAAEQDTANGTLIWLNNNINDSTSFAPKGDSILYALRSYNQCMSLSHTVWLNAGVCILGYGGISQPIAPVPPPVSTNPSPLLIAECQAVAQSAPAGASLIYFQDCLREPGAWGVSPY